MQLPARIYSFTPYRCLLLLLVLVACGEDIRRTGRLKAGSELARQYCGSCHAFPGPALLDKTTWEKDVLPVMGARLGIKQYLGSYYRQPVLSDTPGRVNSRITMEEWDQIVEYYTTVAPWRPMPQERPVPVSWKAPPIFTIREPARQGQEAPLTSFVGIDTLRRRLWVADAHDSVLHIYNNQLQLLQQLRTPGIVSDINIPATGHTGYLTSIGSIFPSDDPRGSIHSFQLHDTVVLQSVPIKKHLPRPVQTLPVDLDGRTYLLLCGFGFNSGYLALLKPGNAVQPEVLLPFPGAVKAYIRDDNQDGRPDIWVLFAQGDEGIWYLENIGNGNFKPERVLQFPPAYGSSSFTLQDVDHDGREDIIYTCGDNADNSRILKPYHGVYIYRNKGNRRFVQQYFYPVNGCYKAIARDMDLDGDEDLLTISFFADYDNQPQEAVLYFEQTEEFNFNVYTLPCSKEGHWICMDAADIDGDGDSDVLLGNFSQGPENFPGLGDRWRKGPPFLLLENNTRQEKKK
jgi:hypothetical protein